MCKAIACVLNIILCSGSAAPYDQCYMPMVLPLEHCRRLCTPWATALPALYTFGWGLYPTRRSSYGFGYDGWAPRFY